MESKSGHGACVSRPDCVVGASLPLPEDVSLVGNESKLSKSKDVSQMFVKNKIISF